MKKQNAYILIFTIAILSLVTVLTHQLLRLVYVGTHFDRTMVDRENAEMLALGGINLAISQLTKEKETPEKPKKITAEEKAKKDKTDLKNFLQRVLPHLNRWQAFELTEGIDGIDGTVKICITCENGKININEAFDFQKQTFKEPYKKMMQALQFKGQKGAKLVNLLTDFLKKRNKKIEDISQLQGAIPEKLSKLFYEPPKTHAKPKRAKPNKSLALQDIFTIWNNKTLEALFLSDSLCAMLKFRRPRAHDSILRKEKFKSVIENFNPSLNQNDQKYWLTVTPIYEPKSTFKVDTTKIFSPKFEPNSYSVLSSGRVGNVEQTLLAILKKEKKSFKVIRLYWI